MSLLKIKDNTGTSKDSFSSIPTITKRILGKSLGDLMKEGIFIYPTAFDETEDLDSNDLILVSNNDDYRTSNIMGYLGYGDETLIIESRFSDSENDFFFQYLLSKVLNLPNVVELSLGVSTNTHLFNLLLFLFPAYLKSAMRKGLFKEYIRRRYNDQNVKGTIDVARHIKENTPFVGNIAYSQREFSYDNELMELIRHTIEFIKAKEVGRTLLSKIKDEVNLIISATPNYKYGDRQKIISLNQKKRVRHAYYKEYQTLQRLCLMILLHQNHDLFSGSKRVYGVLFDGAWLFEEYLNLLISDLFHHPKNKKGEGAQQLFLEDRQVGLIYPDFIGKDPEQRLIADAKYKPINNIGGHDYLQILAYMYRFDSKLGYFLYPEKDGGKGSALTLLKGSTYEGKPTPREDVTIIKHGLKIPTASAYKDFVIQIEKAEKEFREFFE